MNDTSPYQILSPRLLWRQGSPRERRSVLGLWAVLTLACIGLGVLTVQQGWSGMPLRLGGVTVHITLYPPLLICLLLTVAWGWIWGAVPAYLATLCLALYADMPLPWALLFAGANPLGLAVMGIGYQAIAARRELRGLSALLYFVQLGFVASVFSSSGALIWSYTNGIDRTALLAIWQGWWLGGFLQTVLLAGPLLVLAAPALARWQARHARLMAAHTGNVRRSVLRLLGVVSSGVVAYGYLTLHLATQQLEAAGPPSPAAAILRDTTWVFFWVFALIVLFIAFFGYQLFRQWQGSTDALLAQLQHANQRLDDLARTDALTGLRNRRSMDERLNEALQRQARSGGAASVVMLDIDHFKQVNDRHGHPAGDTVLRALAQSIRAEVREVDAAGRYGGEEFLVLLPGTDTGGALLFAERLRRRVAALRVPVDGGDIAITISLGVAAHAAPTEGAPAWLARADRALYQAKRGGRNQSVVADA